jgi:hypothetical protein
MGKLLSLPIAHKPSGAGVAFREDRRPRSHVMRICRQYMRFPFAQHALAPIFRGSPKGPGERASRNLHPDAAIDERANERVVGGNPGQALRMGQNWRVSGADNAEQEVSQSGGRGVMRRFDENIARVGERQEVSPAEGCDKIRHDMVVRAGNEFQGDAALIEFFLQSLNGEADFRASVVKKSRQNMRCTGDNRDPVSDPGARHGNRCLEVRGSVVNARQYMAVKIDHCDWYRPRKDYLPLKIKGRLLMNFSKQS